MWCLYQKEFTFALCHPLVCFLLLQNYVQQKRNILANKRINSYRFPVDAFLTIVNGISSVHIATLLSLKWISTFYYSLRFVTEYFKWLLWKKTIIFLSACFNLSFFLCPPLSFSPFSLIHHQWSPRYICVLLNDSMHFSHWYQFCIHIRVKFFKLLY